jgi:hypothetical protein
MRAFVRGAIWGCIALAVAIQFYRPARANPAVVQERTLEAAVPVPPAVEDILARSCNDCHSNLTRWPWYSNIAPVSWLIADHVNAGRRDLNFSEWLRPSVSEPVEYTRQRFYSVCRELRLGKMPLPSYNLLHLGARLSSPQVQAVCQWAETGL